MSRRIAFLLTLLAMAAPARAQPAAPRAEAPDPRRAAIGLKPRPPLVSARKAADGR